MNVWDFSSPTRNAGLICRGEQISSPGLLSELFIFYSLLSGSGSGKILHLILILHFGIFICTNVFIWFVDSSVLMSTSSCTTHKHLTDSRMIFFTKQFN